MKIINLWQYPEDGKHQECLIDLPFKITKGADSFIYYEKNSDKDYKIYNSAEKWVNKVDNRWIAIPNSDANFSLKEIFVIKPNKNLDKVISQCEKCYIRSLEMEIKRIKKELSKYKNKEV